VIDGASNFSKLKLRYKLLFYASLALGMAFAIVFGYLAASTYAHYFGIADNASVQAHPNGIKWMVSFLGTFFVLIFVGVFGAAWGATKLLAWRFRWSPEQTRAVFWASDYPREIRND